MLHIKLAEKALRINNLSNTISEDIYVYKTLSRKSSKEKKVSLKYKYTIVALSGVIYYSDWWRFDYA